MKRRKHKEQTNGWNVEDSAHGRLKTRKTNAVMTDPYAELGLEGKWTLKDYFLAALIGKLFRRMFMKNPILQNKSNFIRI